MRDYQLCHHERHYCERGGYRCGDDEGRITGS